MFLQILKNPLIMFKDHVERYRLKNRNKGIFIVKERLKYLFISLGIVGIGAGLMAWGIHSANGVHQEFLEIPTITSEEELRNALEGSPKVYCLTDMEISGDPAEDPKNILVDDYAYIMYVEETCSLEKGAYTWESANSTDAYTYNGITELMLFGDVPVEFAEEMTEYNFYIKDYADLTTDMVFDEYKDVVDGSYYPNGIGDIEGNTRYSVYLASMDEKVAMYATVGDGKVVLEYNSDMANYIIPNGDVEALYDCHGGSDGMMMTLIGMMVVLPIGLIALLSCILTMVFSLFKFNKKK